MVKAYVRLKYQSKVFLITMPLVVITGIPSSGKTARAKELREYFESRGKEVCIVSEMDEIKKAGFEKNSFYLGIHP